MKALRHLPALLASCVGLIVAAPPLRADTFQANEADYVPNVINNWGFYGSDVLRITAPGAVSDGYIEFHNNSQINAHAVGAITGGEQYFSNTSSLQVTVDGTDRWNGVITGGYQLFTDSSLLKAGKLYSITGGDQEFYDKAVLTASGAHAITGGYQYFESWDENGMNQNSRLVVNGGGDHGVDGGEQHFYGFSSLQANRGNAVTGGYQYFGDYAHLRASVAGAVNGGTQYFKDSSYLWASATESVTNTTITLENDSYIKIAALNALSSSTNIYFDGSCYGAGGILSLNGYDTTVGEISSGYSYGAGRIENNGVANATLTVDFANCFRTFDGYITDGEGGGSLALVKTGTGTLTLAGYGNDYSGGTTVSGGTLVAGANQTLGSGDVTVHGGTLRLAGTEQYNTVYVNDGGTLSGNGYFSNAIINAGGTLSPGTAYCPVDSLYFGDLTLAGSSNLVIGIKDDGCGGLVSSTIEVWNSYTLDLSGVDAEHPLTLKLVSEGVLANLMAGHLYQMGFLFYDNAADGTLLSLGDNVSLDLNAFQTSLEEYGGASAFSLSLVQGEGNAYVLNFAPVPEPSTYALLALGAGLTGFAAWRKRRRA